MTLNTTAPCSTLDRNTYNYSESDIYKPMPKDSNDDSTVSHETLLSQFKMKKKSERAALHTAQEYNYYKPDIFKEMMPIESKADFEKGLLPQDKYLSKKFLKEILRKSAEPKTISTEDHGKIKKAKALVVLTNLLSAFRDLDKEKFAGAYLFDYLDKTKVQREEEAEVAFDTLTSQWTTTELKNISDGSFDYGKHLEKIIEKLAPRLIERYTPDFMIESDNHKSTELIIEKINSVIDELNHTIQDVITNEETVSAIFHGRIKPQADALTKLQEQTLPKLNERIEDLEDVSTHVIHGLNEEVQKLFEKIARLEASALDTYFINENLKKEISDKDTKIVLLASKVDAFQEEIFEVKAVNQAQAKTIQEFEERQMKMEEEQKLQRQLLESLLKIQMESEKKEQTAK